MKAKEWTIKEVTLLKAHYYKSTDAELAAMFPSRTPCAIYNKALTLGLSGKYKLYR